MSTQGSFLRQLGWHSLARGWDGRALALAAGDPEACADALIGLAADALGIGRFAAAATLLARTEPLLASPDSEAAVPDRLRSEEHTSELQSRRDLVCRLLLEKKKMRNEELTEY